MKLVIDNRQSCLQGYDEIVLRIKKTTKYSSIIDYISKKFHVPEHSISLIGESGKFSEDTEAKDLKFPVYVRISVDYPEELLEEAINSIKSGSDEDLIKVLANSSIENWNLERLADKKGWSLIHYTCLYNRSSLIKELFLNNAKSVNLPAKDGWTPLQICSYHGYVSLVKSLLQFKKVKINQITKQGTALHKAVENNHKEVVEILIGNGADLHIENPEHKTCIELATSEEMHELISMLNGKNIISEQFNFKSSNMAWGGVTRASGRFFRDYQCLININIVTGKYEEYENSSGANILKLKKKIIKIEAVQNCSSSSHFYFEVIFPDVSLKYYVRTANYRDQIVGLIKKASDYCKCNGIGIRPEPMKKNYSLSVTSVENHSKLIQKNVSLKEFDKITVIGSGSFGVVFLVKNKYTQELFALKSSDRMKIAKKSRMRFAITECEILKSLDNPFVVKLYWAFATKKHLNLILEYCPGGDLASLLEKKKNLAESEIRFLLASIVLGLEYIHEKNIVCRDLKPANLLIDLYGYLKLCDFGLAQNNVESDKMNAKLMGSPSYLSPEGIMTDKVGKKSDIWSLGIIAYQLYCRFLPFKGEDVDQLYENIVSKEISYPANMSNESKNFMKFLLQRDPNKRPDIKQVKDHQYFDNIDWDLYEKKKYEAPSFLIKKRLEFM